MKKEILKLIEQEIENVVKEAYTKWDQDAERGPTRAEKLKYEIQQKKLENFRKLRNKQIEKAGLTGPGWDKPFVPDGKKKLFSKFYEIINNKNLGTDQVREDPYFLEDPPPGWPKRKHTKKEKEALDNLARLIESSQRSLMLAKKYQDIFLPGGEMFELYTTPKKIFKIKPEQVGRVWNELTFHIKDAYEVGDVHKLAEINRDFMNALGDGIKAQREMTKGFQDGKLSPKDMADISNNVFENLFLQLQNARMSDKEIKYDISNLMDIGDMGSYAINETLKLDEKLLKDIIEKSIEERLSLSSIKKGLAGLGIAATMASSGANAANYEPVQTDTGRPAMVLKRIGNHSDADDFNTIQDKLEKLRKKNPSKFVSVAVKSEGDAWVPYYQISDKPVIDPQIKKKAEEQGREIRTLQIFEIDEMPEDYLKIINDRVHGLGGQVAQIVRFGGLVDSSGKENMSQPPNDVVVFYTVPGVQKENILREELTKSEIKKLINDEITAFARQQLKKMVEEELEKALGKTDIKNKVGDISKDILKKLYKDLSLHHTYVIDRVKL